MSQLIARFANSGIPISGMGAMFANHLSSLESEMADIGIESITALMKPTMENLTSSTIAEAHNISVKYHVHSCKK